LDLGRTCFGVSEQYAVIPGEAIGVSNVVNCYKEAVQFSASFVTSLFASLDEICGTSMSFVLLSSE